MADIASLGIRVSTQGVTQAKTELEGLSQSSRTAAAAAKEAGASWEKNTFSPARLYAANKALADYKKGLLAATAAATATGTKGAEGFAKAAKSAKELQFATRNLPAQFTDIATALGSGQRPLQVLLQQGGQIKDMFGGIGPAIRAMGGYILGLVNPFTLAAAAVAGLGLAWKNAQDEAAEFNKAIILTGNYANLTAADLAAMARQLDESTNATAGAASDALAQVTATGRFTAEQIGLVTKAALQMQDATGKAIEDTIKEFVSLKGDPVDAILKLNEAQHFLTEETLKQIKSLKEQGREADAAAVAIRAYAGTINDRTPDVVRNLSLMSQWWRDVKSAVRELGDEASQVFRQLDVNARQVLQNYGEYIKGLSNVIRTVGFVPFGDSMARAADNFVNNANKPDFSNVRGTPGAKTVDSSEARKAIKEAEDAQRDWNSAIQQGETQAQRLKRELAEVAEAGKRLGKSDPEIKAAQDAVRAAFASKGGASRGGGGSRAARPQFQIDSGAAEQELQRLADAEKRASEAFLDMEAQLQGPLAVALRDHQKRVEQLKELATQSPTAMAGLNDALALEEQRHKENVAAIEAQLDPLGQLLDDMALELELIGKSNAERAVMLELRRNNIDAMSAEGQAALATARAFEDEAAAKQRSIDLMDDFRQGAADALTDFVTGAKSAKEAFTDFFDEIARRITQMIAERWIEQLFGAQGSSGQGTSGGDALGGILGAFFGSGSSSSQGSLFDLFSGSWGFAKGAAFEGGGIKAFANGGVVGGPTLFNMGLMGEAGPEAILPLHRGPDGKLGVRMEAANDGSAPRHLALNQTFVVQGAPDRRTREQMARESGRAARRGMARTGS